MFDVNTDSHPNYSHPPCALRPDGAWPYYHNSDFADDSIGNTPMPTTTVWSNDTFGQTSTTAPYFQFCRDVTNPEGEITAPCLDDEGNEQYPVANESGLVPCDSTPPMTLGPGCIGYEPEPMATTAPNYQCGATTYRNENCIPVTTGP